VGHLVPHAPQSSLSVLVSTHVEPQSVSLLGQVVVHLPPEHALPLPHLLPQLPQSSPSVLVSTHLPEHSV
jgi:hypothetical protein